VIVLDETVNVGWLVGKTTHFFKHESCGKCTPCREGTFWMEHIAHRIVSGNGSQADIELLKDVARQIQGKCLCPLGEFSIMAVMSGIDKFREDFEALVTH
jgi:NADH-quinone oxidoreductase subunit F